MDYEYQTKELCEERHENTKESLEKIVKSIEGIALSIEKNNEQHRQTEIKLFEKFEEISPKVFQNEKSIDSISTWVKGIVIALIPSIIGLFFTILHKRG